MDSVGWEGTQCCAAGLSRAFLPDALHCDTSTTLLLLMPGIDSHYCQRCKGNLKKKTKQPALCQDASVWKGCYVSSRKRVSGGKLFTPFPFRSQEAVKETNKDNLEFEGSGFTQCVIKLWELPPTGYCVCWKFTWVQRESGQAHGGEICLTLPNSWEPSLTPGAPELKAGEHAGGSFLFIFPLLLQHKNPVLSLSGMPGTKVERPNS